jgi:hypothetical protein
MRTLALLLVLCSTAFAAPPVVRLPSEVKGDVGSFIAVSAECDAPSVAFYAIDAGINLFPPRLLADPKTTVVTSAKAGRYRILAYSGNGDGPSEPVVVTVVVGGAPPIPPGPNPPEPDPQPTPPNLTGFAKLAFDKSRVYTAAERGKVADNFEGTAARIAAGELRTVADANAALKDENARDVNRTTWLPFFQAWAAEADAQNKAGTLRTPDEYAQAFRDTAEGLRK